MAIPQTPPGGGRESAHEHFRYVPTKPGATWYAYLAGDAHWFLAHTKGRSKPCLHAMTGGQLVCERCAQVTPPQVIGYVPLYREVDSRPVMVIVYEYERERLATFKLHQRVLVGREEQQSDGVYLTVALNPKPIFHTTLKHRMKPADLTHVLLRLWGIPELTHWYSVTHGAADAAPVQPPKREPKKEPKQSNGQPFGPMYRNAAVKVEGSDDATYAELAEKLVKDAKAREKNAQKNGKHTAEEEGK